MTISMPELTGVRHRSVMAGDLRVHVAEAGSGPTVLLLHGWPQHWYCWRRIVPLLSETHRVIMPDLRGHGWTEAPPGGYEKEQLVDDLFALMDAMELADVTLVGHDWGGWVGFLAALREPARLHHLVALGIVPPFQQLSPSTLVQAWRGWYQVMLSSPVLARTVLERSTWPIETALRTGGGSGGLAVGTPSELEGYARVLQQPERARASVHMYRTFVFRELPTLHSRMAGARLEVATTLVVGEQDPIAHPALLRGWEGRVREMSVERVPGIGHFLPEEAPQLVADRIIAAAASPSNPTSTAAPPVAAVAQTAS